MIRTLYFEWNSVAPLIGIKAQAILTKNAAQNKKPATKSCAGSCGLRAACCRNQYRVLLVGATGVEPVTYAV
jgi:hypothetical protein